jgi:hypothetical protein
VPAGVVTVAVLVTVPLVVSDRFRTHLAMVSDRQPLHGAGDGGAERDDVDRPSLQRSVTRVHFLAGNTGGTGDVSPTSLTTTSQRT